MTLSRLFLVIMATCMGLAAQPVRAGDAKLPDITIDPTVSPSKDLRLKAQPVFKGMVEEAVYGDDFGFGYVFYSRVRPSQISGLCEADALYLLNPPPSDQRPIQRIRGATVYYLSNASGPWTGLPGAEAAPDDPCWAMKSAQGFFTAYNAPTAAAAVRLLSQAVQHPETAEITCGAEADRCSATDWPRQLRGLGARDIYSVEAGLCDRRVQGESCLIVSLGAHGTQAGPFARISLSEGFQGLKVVILECGRYVN